MRDRLKQNADVNRTGSGELAHAHKSGCERVNIAVQR